MAVTQRIKPMDAYYHLCSNTIMLNDHNYQMQDRIEDINRKLYTVHSSNVISTEPRCDCGNLSTRQQLGKLCSNCNSYCETAEDLDPILWMRDLGYRFINPTFWSMLKIILDKNTDCLRWLSDPSYRPAKKPPFLHGCLTAIGGVRDYQALVDNMVPLIKYIKTISKFRNEYHTLSKLDMLLYMWNAHNADIMSSYLPVPNKSIFVMESTNKGRFINLIVGDVVNIVNEWIKVSSEEEDDRKSKKYTSKLISNLSSLSRELMKEYVVGKKGVFRKHLYGSRAPFTFRCTVSSIPTRHRHNVIEVPWSVALTTYEPYVMNKLTKRGWKYTDAQAHILRCVDSYNEEIDEILTEIENESPYEYGIPICAQRNC